MREIWRNGDRRWSKRGEGICIILRERTELDKVYTLFLVFQFLWKRLLHRWCSARVLDVQLHFSDGKFDALLEFTPFYSTRPVLLSKMFASQATSYLERSSKGLLFESVDVRCGVLLQM